MAVFQELTTYTIECPNPVCPDPADVRRAGFEGDSAAFRCKTCGNAFTPGSASHRQFTAKQIGAALDLYFSGLSYKQLAEHLEDFYDVPEPSKHSTHDWLKGYTIMARRFLDGQVGTDGREDSATGKSVKARVGAHWVADELFVRVEGDQSYLWTVMDKETRYVLAAHLSQHRNKAAAIKVMEKAMAAAEKPPKTVTTDGLEAYVEAIETVFPKGTKHIKGAGIRSEVSNNLAERLQGTLRSRTKTQRGLETELTGQDFVDGYIIDYNHFKKHESLQNRVPAEVAGVSGLVPWDDSWEDIAKMGGEVAERQDVRVEQIKRRTGPKPKDDGEIRNAVEEYIQAEREKKQRETAIKQRRARDNSPVAPYPPPHRKRQDKPRGRGRLL